MRGLLLVKTCTIVILTCALLLAACGSGRESASFPAPAEMTEPAAGSADASFFEFTAPRLGAGGQVTGAELKGKDVALWFWAPW